VGGEIKIELLGKSTDKIRGNIVNISQGAVHVRISQYFSPCAVRVWFSDNCSKEGQLIFCKTEDGAFRAGIHFPPDPQDLRRSEFRVPLANEPVLIFLVDDQLDSGMDAQAVDISRSGLGLLVAKRLIVGTVVRVHLTFGVAFGEVMYSTVSDRGMFAVGLHLETLLIRQGSSAPDLQKPA
jgi:hypothetical protein